MTCVAPRRAWRATLTRFRPQLKHRYLATAVERARPFQPPGLVLLPSTLLPCGPLELEMHGCKHMNTLLGCRYALVRHLVGQRDKEGKKLLEEEVEDFLWDYEW